MCVLLERLHCTNFIIKWFSLLEQIKIQIWALHADMICINCIVKCFIQIKFSYNIICNPVYFYDCKIMSELIAVDDILHYTYSTMLLYTSKHADQTCSADNLYLTHCTLHIQHKQLTSSNCTAETITTSQSIVQSIVYYDALNTYYKVFNDSK